MCIVNNPVNAWDPTGLVVRKLTELAAERGLSVSWNGGSGSNWAVSVSGYTFTLNRQYENGDYSLYLNGLAQDAGQLSLHSDDNKVYIDDGLFDCTIDDGSSSIDEGWMIDVAAVGVVVLAKGGKKIVKGAAKAAPIVAKAAPIIVATDPNKINHIFNNSEHNLFPFLQSFGGDKASAYIAVYNAAQSIVNSNNLTGIYNSVSNPIIVNVNGYEINIGGRVIDGILHIGTFFIK